MTARFSLMALVGVCFAIPGLVFGRDRDAASEGGLDMSENALSGEYFQEGSDGLTSMETEHNDGVTSANGHSWTLSTETEASNGAAMTAGPNSGVNQNTDYVTMSPRLDLRVNFVKTGIHHIWIRGRAPGPDTGSNDSCHVGLDGVGVRLWDIHPPEGLRVIGPFQELPLKPSADRISSFGAAFGWSKVATVNVSSVGVHVVNLWMREDGFVADKIVLTTSDSFVPTGVGPTESARGSTSGGAPIVDSGAPPPVTTSPSGSVDEFVGPFPSWANVKTMYNAKGDGITDDTAALQAALNAQGTAGKSDVVYLPAGTYKITATLKQTGKRYVSFVGQDPATTKIRWAGPAGGWMLWANGVTYSRWGRITWDGANTAGIGVAHKWDKLNVPGYATSAIEHSDEVFQDMKRGIVGGDPGSNYGANDAEVSIIRSKFIRNSEAGVSVESWNALNYWIWDSEFTNNARGVTNIFGAGNFHVYRSVFRNSSIADINIRNTCYFSFRGNTSIGSNRFLLADPIGQNAAPISVQDNKILDTVQADAIADSNVGPLFLIDNVIRSKPGASGPAVTMNTGPATGPDLVSVGNTFTVAAPISVSTQAANARSWAQDDQVVPYASIDGTIPTLPATPVSMNRTVFEIAPGANSAGIQQAIDQAAALSGQRPVVHLPKGSYSIGTTLSVPANADLQIVGDGWNSGTELVRRRRRDHSADERSEPGDLARVRYEWWSEWRKRCQRRRCRECGSAGGSRLPRRLLDRASTSNRAARRRTDKRTGRAARRECLDPQPVGHRVQGSWRSGKQHRGDVRGRERFERGHFSALGRSKRRRNARGGYLVRRGYFAGCPFDRHGDLHVLGGQSGTVRQHPRESSRRAERVFRQGYVRRSGAELVRQFRPRDRGHQRDQSNERSFSWECEHGLAVFLAHGVRRKRLVPEQ